jgi:hypothetical protein
MSFGDEIVLMGAENYTPWCRTLRRKAKILDILKFIDPKAATLEVLEDVELGPDEDIDPKSDEDSDSESAVGLNLKPYDDDETITYKYNLFKRKQTIRWKRDLAKLEKYFANTVSAKIFSCIPKGRPVAEQIAFLHHKYSEPSKIFERQKAERNYLQAREFSPNNPVTSEWVENFLNVSLLAEVYKVPYALGFFAQMDLIQAVHWSNPFFSTLTYQWNDKLHVALEACSGAVQSTTIPKDLTIVAMVRQYRAMNDLHKRFKLNEAELTGTINNTLDSAPATHADRVPENRSPKTRRRRNNSRKKTTHPVNSAVTVSGNIGGLIALSSRV